MLCLCFEVEDQIHTEGFFVLFEVHVHAKFLEELEEGAFHRHESLAFVQVIIKHELYFIGLARRKCDPATPREVAHVLNDLEHVLPRKVSILIAHPCYYLLYSSFIKQMVLPLMISKSFGLQSSILVALTSLIRSNTARSIGLS